jgi:hypothetical protein
MPLFVESSLPWVLTRGMASVLGVNLVAAVTEGWYSREELARLVDRCGACPLSALCSAWLAKTAQADALPDYCPNKSAIEALGG